MSSFLLAYTFLTCRYTIAEEESDRTASSLFNIEPSTGLVTLNSPLDRETKASHVITVLAFVETTPELVASTQVRKINHFIEI